MAFKNPVRRISYTAAALALALLAAGCSSKAGTDSSSGEPDLKDVTLKVGVIGTGDPAAYKASGLFDDVPYNLEFVVANFPEQAAGLNSGELDVAFYGITSSINQAGNGNPDDWTAENAPVKLIAGWAPDPENETAWFGTAVRTDSGITDLDDLAGRTWASNSSGDAYATFLANLEQADLTTDDITEVKFDANPDQVAAFASGQTDVFTGSIGAIAELIVNGDAEVLVTSHELGVPVFQGYAARPATLDDPGKEAAIADWIKRHNEYLTSYWESNEDKVVQTLVDADKQAENVAEYNWQAQLTRKPRTFDDELYQHFQHNVDLYLDAGIISQEVDVSALFDDRFNESIGAVPLF